MKVIAQTLSVLFAMVLIFISACTEPTTIGTDLLDQDQADIRFIDTFTLRTATIKEDSVRIYDPNPQAQFLNYLCGNYSDPVFGSVTSDLYIQFRNGDSNPPDFMNARIDSLILKLEYDSSGMYGNFNQMQTLEVFRINEFIDNDTSYYSNRSFAVGNTLLGSANFRPRFDDTDSLTVLTYFNGDTSAILQPPHLRINLEDQTLIDLLTNLDSVDYEDDNFIQAFNGLFVKATMPTQAMMSFNLSTDVSGLTIYYKTIDDEHAQYEYDIFSSTLKHSNYKHDFTGTPVNDALGNRTIGDSILYLQGLSGPNIEVEIPYASTLRDQVIVNKAELVFTIESDINDPVFFPVDQIILTERNDEGTLVVISDVLFSLSRSDLGLFGGRVEETTNSSGQVVNTYSLNISSHFQNIIDGDASPVIVLRVFPKQERASRVLLYGPNHSRFPAKLNLTYTNLNQ